MAEKIIDNKMNLLGDDLKAELRAGSKVRIAASCFTLFAFNELREELGRIEELKVIFTQPTYTKNDYIADAGKRERREFYIPKKERESSLFGTDFEIRLRNKMSLKAIAKECAAWVEKKVKFASNTTNGNMQNFIAVEQMDGRKVAYFPTPAEFSASGLGYEKTSDMILGTCKSDTPSLAEYYLSQFDEIFADKTRTEDVTDGGYKFMPYKPKKPCAYPGCPKLVHERYCEEHKAVVDKQYNLYGRDKDVQAFYESTAWRWLRRIKLETNPLCEEYLKAGKPIKATTADHIVPIKQGGAPLDINNLQSLCGSCHGVKSIK